MRQLWRHVRSGEVWAVALGPDGQIIGACGPLDESEQDHRLLPEFHYDPEEAEDIRGHEDEFVLVEEDPVRRTDWLRDLAGDIYTYTQCPWSEYAALNPGASPDEYAEALIEGELDAGLRACLDEHDRRIIREWVVARVQQEQAQ